MSALRPWLVRAAVALLALCADHESEPLTVVGGGIVGFLLTARNSALAR